MINNREEALVAHELVRTRIANRKQLNFTPFEKNQKVWLDTRNLKMNHHKEIVPKQEGPFENNKVLRPNLLTETSQFMEDTQHVSCNTTQAIHQK
jgi:hypothetical protein